MPYQWHWFWIKTSRFAIMHHKQWSINQEKGAGEKQSYKCKFGCRRMRALTVMPVTSSCSVLVHLYVLYYFLSLVLEWILLCDKAILRFDWEQSPNFEILCCVWQAYPYADTRVWALVSVGFSALCEGARELVLVLQHGQVSGSGWWDGRVSQLNSRKPKWTSWRCFRKKAVSAECFSFDKLLNTTLILSFLPGSCVYLHIHLCTGRGRNRCFLMFLM